MNEQIEKLARQAADGMLSYHAEGEWQLSKREVQKFAELIVRECLDIAQDRAAFDCYPPNDVNHIIDEIKEHFGVE